MQITQFLRLCRKKINIYVLGVSLNDLLVAAEGRQWSFMATAC